MRSLTRDQFSKNLWAGARRGREDVTAFTNCRGDEDIDANGRDRRSENPFLGHAKKERVSLFGTDQRITSGPAARRPHQGRIHDRTRTLR